MLRIDFYRLKHRADARVGEPPASRPTFVEFTSPVTFARWSHGAGSVGLVPSGRPELPDVRPNIFWAKPGDFTRATHRVFHEPVLTSFFERPVIPLG
jgi:hypothetical protein